MAAETIAIPLDTGAANARKAAPEETEKNMQALIRRWLRDLATADPSKFRTLMREMGRKARACRLTVELLGSLMKEA